MTHGTVKWFDPRKGYGFIVGEDGSDVFVHFSSIETKAVDATGFRKLADGEEVGYFRIETEKGSQAQHVQHLSAI